MEKSSLCIGRFVFFLHPFAKISYPSSAQRLQCLICLVAFGKDWYIRGMINTALVIGARHLSHSVRIMVFSHDGKGIPARAGISVLAILLMWCFLRMINTLLRGDGDVGLPQHALNVGAAVVIPLLLRSCMRVAVFFVFAHASLAVEMLLFFDALSSSITGQPLFFTEWVLLALVVWSVGASFITTARYMCQPKRPGQLPF